MTEPIRILQFPGTLLYGGVGSVVMNWYRNIDRTKIQFDFCVPRTQKGPLDDEIKMLGGRIFHIPQMRTSGFAKYMKAIKEIISENGPYKAVHIHSIHMGAIPLMVAKSMGIPAVYHAHNSNDNALRDIPLHHIIEYFLRLYIRSSAKYKLACGTLAGKFIFAKHRFNVINNAIDLRRFYPYSEDVRASLRSKYGMKQDDIIVGNVARFSAVKNMQIFIKLAIEDKQNRGKLKFLLVGDGEEKASIEKEIAQNKLSNCFILTGSRSDAELFYNIMDVFCLPSKFEGLPVSLMEAQASGLPCVISDVVTTEGVVGSTIVKSISLNANMKEWINAIYELSDKRTNNSELITTSFIKKKYDIISIAKDIEDFYINII